MNLSTVRRADESKAGINTLQRVDSPIHGWYRFVLSYPPHLVRQYVERFDLTSDDCLLDPFCGTGTTLVEAKKRIGEHVVELGPRRADVFPLLGAHAVERAPALVDARVDRLDVGDAPAAVAPAQRA